MAFKRVELPKDELIADFDPLNQTTETAVEEPVAEKELTLPELAEKGLQDYLEAFHDKYNLYESISLGEESQILINAVKVFEEKANPKKQAFKSRAYELQKYLHVGLQLKLMAEAQAETNPELKKLFADLFQNSKRARDRIN